jgi:sulfoxide reductase heme-binding subunit YedZ
MARYVTNALWYLGRGTGVSALVLLTLVLVLGIVVRSGRSISGLPRYAVAAIHRTSSLTAVGLVVVHVVTLLFDPFAQLRLVDLVLPFVASFRPIWMGLGTLATELIVLLVASSLLRAHLRRRTWRLVHWTAYLSWPFAVAHSVGSGTDGGSTWLLAVVGACALAVVCALAWRLSASFASLPVRRPVSVGRASAMPGVRR